MKLLLIFGVLLLAGLALAEQKTYSRGCIYILGRCSRECEEGTHAYAIGCDYLQPEPTCDDLNPEKETRFRTCDFSACYCDPPTVKNVETNQCVKIEDCPKKPASEKPERFLN